MPRKLACGHKFHLFCISKWIQGNNNNCPLCRKEIKVHSNTLLRNNLILDRRPNLIPSQNTRIEGFSVIIRLPSFFSRIFSF